MAEIEYDSSIDDKEESSDKDEIYEGYYKDLAALALEVQDMSYDFTDYLEEISDMKYILIPHPEDDILSFNELYTLTQGYLTRTVDITIIGYREKAKWVRLKNEAKRIYNKAKGNLLAEEDIKKLRNQDLRITAAEKKMKGLVDFRDYITSAIEDIELFIDTAKLRTEDLNKANVNLRSQQNIIEMLPGLNYPVRVINRRSN